MKALVILPLLAFALSAAESPRFAGKWTVDAFQSRSDFEPVTAMTVEQTRDHFRIAQTDKDGKGAHSFQADCATDGGVHAVADADDATILCRWDGATLVTEQNWKKNQQRKTTRLSLNTSGNLVQEIKTSGPEGAMSANLVWVKLDRAPAVPEQPRAPVTENVDPVVAPLPAPYATPSVDNHQTVIRTEKKAFLHGMEGFEVSLWASGFQAPRLMLQGGHGEILVSDAGFDVNEASPVNGRQAAANGVIYVFPGGDPQKRKALISGLDRPSGMALWKEFLYVAEAESIKRYPYDAVGLVAGKGKEIISLKGFSKGHWTRSLQFDRDGQKLYVGIGSEKNVAEGEDPRRAAINRYNPDGSGHEIYSSGMRNPTALRLYPGSDILWAGVQERDELGDSLVPDYFTSVVRGGFYGWPWTYIGHNQDPRMKAPSPGLVDKTVEPDTLLGAHVAVLDFCFYNGDKFPKDFQGGAFVALHGSWNRSTRDGYVVRFIPLREGEAPGKGFDFVAGWTDSGDEKTVLGRPSGVLMTADGRLLISDDGTGRIWQVLYRGEGTNQAGSSRQD